MTPVYMTTLFDRATGSQGNHLASCIASLLQIPIKDVPPLETMSKVEVIAALQDFLVGHGYQIVVHDNSPVDGCWTIALGRITPSVTHSCIYFGSRLVHNPHPLAPAMSQLDMYIELKKIGARKKVKKSGQPDAAAVPGAATA